MRGAAGEDLHEQRLLHPRAAGRERHRARDLVDGEDEQHVLHRAADAEGVQQEPEGGEAAQPGHRLQGGDFAQVAAPVAEDRHALTDARPEGPRADRQQRERDQAADGDGGDQEQRQAEVLGQVGDVEGAELREVGRLGEDTLGEGEDQDEDADAGIEDRLHEEGGRDRRVARAGDRGAGEEQLDHVPTTGRDDVVEADRGEVGAPHAPQLEGHRRIGGAKAVEEGARAQRQVRPEEQQPERTGQASARRRDRRRTARPRRRTSSRLWPNEVDAMSAGTHQMYGSPPARRPNYPDPASSAASIASGASSRPWRE